MKPHITNLKHRQFCNLIDNTIYKIEKTPCEEKIGIGEKITELINNKNTIEKIYADYQFKLKELSHILDEYEKIQHTSRINLRKMQLWLKISYNKVVKNCF